MPLCKLNPQTRLLLTDAYCIMPNVILTKEFLSNIMYKYFLCIGNVAHVRSAGV